MSTKDLDGLRAQVEILRIVKEKKAELKELEETARAAVEAELGDAEWGTLDGEPAVHLSTYKRTSFDLKAFKKVLPGVAEEYMTTTVVNRFEVC